MLLKNGLDVLRLPDSRLEERLHQITPAEQHDLHWPLQVGKLHEELNDREPQKQLNCSLSIG